MDGSIATIVVMAIITQTKAIIFLLLILLSNVVYGTVSLVRGTILNTTVSNSSMTFFESVTVNSVIIEDSNITLTNMTCSDTDRVFPTVLWDTPNANYNTIGFCAYDTSAKSKAGYFALPIAVWFFAMMIVFIQHLYGVKK